MRSKLVTTLGFTVEETNIGHVPVRYLSFMWISKHTGKELTVQVAVTADPWFSADALRKMADRIEELNENEPAQKPK